MPTDAVEMGTPGSYKVLFSLANLLGTRFVENPSNGDYEDAMALFERILDTKQPGKCPDWIRQLVPLHAASLAFARSGVYQNPQDSETTISRLRTLRGSSSIDEGLRFETTRALEIMNRARFVQYSLAESLEESNSYSSQVYALSSAQNREECPATNAVRESYSTTRILEKIQHLEEQLSITPPGTERHNECLRHIADWYQSKFDRTNDISDIEESIKYNGLSVETTHLSSDHLYRKMVFRFSLYETLVLAFKETNKIGYLDELINICYDIFNLKGLQHCRFGTVQRLMSSLLKREELLGGTEDRREAIRLVSIVADGEYAQEPDRFLLACRWAIVARSISHPTTLGLDRVNSTQPIWQSSPTSPQPHSL